MTIEDFCSLAYKAFNLRDANQDYVEVLVAPTSGHLVLEEETLDAELLNPFVFLSSLRSDQLTAHALKDAAPAPSISLVVGTYGLGKTELMHQLCRHLLQSRKSYRSPYPLPVNLALCNQQVQILAGTAPPRGEEFADLLFHHIAPDDESRAFIRGPLLSAIANGEVFLILDGLDELAINAQQYLGFLDGLSNLLALGAKLVEPAPPLSRVVISMRYEYLTALDSESGTDLVRVLRNAAPGAKPLPVYFLRLDLFDNSQVQTYMNRRQLPPYWFPEVSKHEALLEILYRPLLLRIFCDMASTSKGRQVFEKLKDYKNAAQLIDDYVQYAASDIDLQRAQDKIERLYEWDTDELARECLDLYFGGSNAMGVENLRKILRPSVEEASIEEAEVDDVWRSIHKCPFLRRSGEKVVFTHRSFLEFFVAKGVWLDMVEKQNEKFSAFDTLVLNVDTRKFLKSIVVQEESLEKWFWRTRRAYGLFDEEEWDPLYRQDLEALNEERKALLDAMSEPENKEITGRAWGHLSTFLDRDHGHLHPRYLTYNYEAVAVFLKSNRGEDLRAVRDRFGSLVRERLETTMAELERPLAKPELRSPKELLVETILNIALRLRYDWAIEYEEDSVVQRLEKLIEDPDIQGRMLATIKDIKRTFFVGRMSEPRRAPSSEDAAVR
jgi:hypothetical protein